MPRKMKKLLALAVAGTLAAAMVFPAHALRYDGSSYYESGKYYRALTQVQLTGDQRTDIVSVALSQVGYQEGGSRTQLSGEVFGGVNFTEYGNWYGFQDMWCAMFASWCAHVAQIPETVVPRHSYTPEGLQWFRSRGLAHSREELAAGAYVPRPGDLIYFRSSRNENRTNHVGIVVACEGGKIYTVEGNIGSSSTYSNGGMVDRVCYPITSTYIVAVCSPNYVPTGTNVVTDTTKSLRQAIRIAEGSGYDQVVTAYADTIAVGTGNWYGTHAQSLLLKIREADPDTFAQLDTAGIGEDLTTADWSHYQPDEEKLQCIRTLIGTEVGCQVQDRVLAQQLEDAMETGRQKGITDEDALQLYALVCHLGGDITADRLLTQAGSDPTAEALLTALDSPRSTYLRSAAQLLTA